MTKQHYTLFKKPLYHITPFECIYQSTHNKYSITIPQLTSTAPKNLTPPASPRNDYSFSLSLVPRKKKQHRAPDDVNIYVHSRLVVDVAANVERERVAASSRRCRQPRMGQQVCVYPRLLLYNLRVS